MAYVMQNLPWFVLFIGVLVFVHEAGHFVIAKLCNVKVLRFSLGFGPRLFGYQRGETDYCVSAVPLGGFVKMLGEVPGQEIPAEDLPRAFSSRPLWQRTAIVLAGPVANVILAWVVYLGIGWGTHTVDDSRLGIVNRGEAAWEAGLRPGDRILEIDGQPIRDWEDVREQISGRPNHTLSVVYDRAGTRHETVVKETGPLVHKHVTDRARIAQCGRNR